MTPDMVPQEVLRSLSAAVACVDDDEVFVAVNEAYAALFATTTEALIGRALPELGGVAENQAFFDALRATARDGVRRRVRNHSADHRGVYDNTLTRIGDLTVIEVADVTEEVREHERRVQIQTARDVIWERVVEYFLVFDLVDRHIVASPAVRERWPIEQLDAAVKGGTILDALDNPTSWSDPWVDEASLFDGRVERAIAEVFTSGEEQRHQSVVPLSGGRLRFFDTFLVPWLVGDELRGVIIISHDQTEFVRAREQRSMAEQAMAELLADLPASVWEVDVDAQTIRPLFADRRTPTLPTWGQPTPLDAYLEGFDEDSRIRLRATLGDLEPDGRAALRVSGREHDRFSHISLHRVPSSTVGVRRRVLTVVTDVTDEVAEDEARSRVDHSTHVMRFAQGVAHDFGNVAQVVGGYSELLMRSQDPRVVEQASTHLASAAQRAVSVSRRIATIAKVQQVRNGPVDLGVLVRDCAADLQGQLGSGIELVIDGTPGLLGIGERNQVASALENLCQNAAEAMNGAGRIAISVARVTRRGRRFVEVTVADSGPGIPEGMLNRVFDPFVTGRPDAGTGLGLYLIQEYLYSVRGEIEVESTTDGATFHLLFPEAA